jgi:hypothetical protein
MDGARTQVRPIDSDTCGLPGCTGKLPKKGARYCSKSCRQKADYHRNKIVEPIRRLIPITQRARDEAERQAAEHAGYLAVALPVTFPTSARADQPGPWGLKTARTRPSNDEGVASRTDKLTVLYDGRNRPRAIRKVSLFP